MLRKSGEPKPLIWRGTSKVDFMAFPPAVQREMGYALFVLELGERHPAMTRTLKGFGGGTVVEVKESHDGNAYRAVCTVRFADAVYVLHAFQKKSRRGIETSKADISVVAKRLKDLIDEKEKRR